MKNLPAHEITTLRPKKDATFASAGLDVGPRSGFLPQEARRERWATVARLGGIGDNLIASAVFPGLKRKYDRLEVIAAKPQSAVFHNNPHIDKLEQREQNDPPWGDGLSWHAWFESRARGVDFLVNLSHSCEGLRACLPISSYFYWPAEARRKLCGQNYLETVADIVGVDYSDLQPGFFPTDEEWERAHETKARVGPKCIGWVISGTRIDKAWPYSALAIARIIKELKLPVVAFGYGSKDFETATQIEQSIRTSNGSSDGFHLALSPADNPSWPIRRSLTQVQQCDLVIAPDTGLAWAAAMHDMPKLIMLSHASEENIIKYWNNATAIHADPDRVKCWPCHCLHDKIDTCKKLSGSKDDKFAACMSDISVETIVSNVARLLS
jgi:ADP-heptose:LPS heptosyltransferase